MSARTMPASSAARTVWRMNLALRLPPFARSDWWTTVGLLVLCVVPTAAGIYRVVEVAGGPVVTDENARFVHDPLPAFVHIVSALLFCVLGAFQVTRAPRNLSLRWHRLAGRVLAPLGVIGGLSGVWLAVAYWTLTKDGPVLFSLRWIAGLGMAACVFYGVVRVVKGDVAGHRAWLLRGYALGIAAGTQFFTHLPFFLVHGGLLASQLETTVAMAAGWVINLVVVERHLRRAR